MKLTLKIGRDNSNDIVINEPRVSRNHAIITYTGYNRYEVKDLGSSNGTFVNGKRITQGSITPGDKLIVGESIVNWYKGFIDAQKINQVSVLREDPFSKIQKTITVGAEPGNDIIINSNFVSATHAKISLLKNGNYFIQDLSSRNGTFVFGERIVSKNFTKTDVIKIADAELPANWFRHNNLTPHFVKDHKKRIFIIAAVLLFGTVAALLYFNRCAWLNKGCTLTATQVYDQNKNSLVHIVHEYYYTIEGDGKIYFIGRNREFKGVEANTSKENLLPYAAVYGSGCFIKPDGTIITAPVIINPWLNDLDIEEMLALVKESRTLPASVSKSDYTVCGQTARLQFLVNGQVNNPENYISATGNPECLLNGNLLPYIQSVKKNIPGGAVYAKPAGKKIKSDKKESVYYYGNIHPVKDNVILKDTFYAVKEKLIVSQKDAPQLNGELPSLTEGSPVFNNRGVLVAIVQQGKLIYIN